MTMPASEARACLQPGHTCDELLLFTREAHETWVSTMIANKVVLCWVSLHCVPDHVGRVCGRLIDACASCARFFFISVAVFRVMSAVARTVVGRMFPDREACRVVRTTSAKIMMAFVFSPWHPKSVGT